MSASQPTTSLPLFNAARAGEQHACGPLRRSTRGRWRALTLLAVYALAAVHIVHWKLAGRTLTPVEPSEAMKTLELGHLNAGFVFFLLTIVSTLIFGRFFCGWACHIVALQDLCGWLLRKLRIRPKPFRSRLLVFVPLLAAVYMFVLPQVVRWWDGRALPPLAAHLFTDDFWEAFPGPWTSAVTFAVCGFLIVYLLGNKGFCTYGCPYGGFFGVADLVAPGRIRVNEDCNQCGHCTATCTSNVRVHAEVARFGMVVDPGCMKCMDCVSVCPNDALYFGFAAPGVMASRAARSAPQRPDRTRPFDYTWAEEIGLAGAFLVALYALRDLYDAVPFLLALGLAAILAFLMVQAARMFYRPSLRLHNLQLRIGGRITAGGWVFAASAAGLALLVIHSAAIQFHTREGMRLALAAQSIQRERPGIDESAVAASSRDAVEHLLWSDRYGFVTPASVKQTLGDLCLHLSDARAAETHFRAALHATPKSAAARHGLAEALALRGDLRAAATELESLLQDYPGHAAAQRDLAALRARIERPARDRPDR